MIARFPDQVADKRDPEQPGTTPAKTWSPPRVIIGTLDEAEAGAAGTVDGGIFS